MGTGYTRNDTSNNIADGNIINAADLDGEFDAIESAMGTSGHTHDGTSAEGGPVTVLGPVQDFVASATEIKPKTTNTLDIGTSGLLFKDMFLDGVATVGSIKIDNAGTIGSASDSDAIAISSGGVVSFSQAPLVDVTNATTNAVTDVLGIQVQSSGTPAVGIGSGLTLGVETAAGNVETGGAIRSITTGLTPTAEEIDLVFYSMRNGNLTEGFRYDSSADNFDVTGSISIDGGSTSADFTFGDNDKAIFGAGSDLQIYHDGNHSIIEDAGTGAIKVKVGDFRVENASGNNLIKGVGDVATLHYDGSEKLATTNTGVDITGTLTSDEVTVQQSAFTRALIGSTGANGAMLVLDGDSNGDGSGGDYSYIYHNTSGQLEFLQDSPAGTNEMLFNTAGNNLRMKIGSGGDISFYDDQGSSQSFYWDASAESLGIGTTSPDTAINIGFSGADQANSLRIEGSNGSSERYALDIEADGENAKTNFKIGVGGGAPTTRMTINSSGNVGIGTDSPIAILDVKNATNEHIVISGSSTYGSNAIIGVNDSGGEVGLGLGGNTVEFYTAATERMRIDSSGNVGIGATGATNKLVVNRDSTTAATNAQIVSENRTGATGQYALYATSLDNGSGSGFKPVAFGAVQTAASGRTADFIVAVSDTDNVDLSADERMRITSAGNVGIGTDSPSLNASYDRTIHIHSTLGSLIKLTDATSGTTDADGTELINYGNDTYLVNRDAGNTIFGTSGSERMRIDSSGNVGIGTSSPDTALHVAGKSTVRNTIVSNFTLDGGVQVPNPYDGFGFGIDFIGRDYGNAVRDYAYIYSVMEASGSSAGGGDASFKAGLRFYTNGGGASGTIPTERMRIDSSGNLLVNTIASQSGLAKAAIEFDSGSQYGLEIKDAGSGTTGTLGIFYRGTTAVGSISTNGSTTAYNTSSDYRLKENVVELTGATTRLKQLDPKRFNFIADDTTTVDGFLAHEVQSVVPEAITGIHNEVDADGNPVYQGIDQSKLVPLLVATIKELEARITALENT